MKQSPLSYYTHYCTFLDRHIESYSPSICGYCGDYYKEVRIDMESIERALKAANQIITPHIGVVCTQEMYDRFEKEMLKKINEDRDETNRTKDR